jgi:hypothetical protein
LAQHESSSLEADVITTGNGDEADRSFVIVEINDNPSVLNSAGTRANTETSRAWMIAALLSASFPFTFEIVSRSADCFDGSDCACSCGSSVSLRLC